MGRSLNSSSFDGLFDEVLSYFEEQIHYQDAQLEKFIEAGDFITSDKERAEIIFRGVVAVLARKITPAPLAKAKPVRSTKVLPEARVQESENAPNTASVPKFRGVLATTAYQCIQQIEGGFTVNVLIEKIRAAGYQFYSHPDVSVNTVLQKFLKDRLVEVVEPGAGRRATVYQRKEGSRREQI